MQISKISVLNFQINLKIQNFKIEKFPNKIKLYHRYNFILFPDISTKLDYRVEIKSPNFKITDLILSEK